jgi:hypothetical protein
MMCGDGQATQSKDWPNLNCQKISALIESQALEMGSFLTRAPNGDLLVIP